MADFGVLTRGLLAGFAIAAPVGPVNVLCMSRTIAKGWKSGLVSGLGAAAADAIYGSIAGFSITFIIQFLLREKFWIRLIGGAFLILVGVSYYRKMPQPLAVKKSGGIEHSDFVSAFLLNLTNPTTVLSFLAVLAALGGSRGEPWWLTWLLVLGIFSGSLLWWIVLIVIVNRFRDQFNDRAMLWMNRIAGLAIGGFGIFTMAMSRSASL